MFVYFNASDDADDDTMAMTRFSNGPKDLSEISQRSAFLSKSLFFTDKFVSLSFCFLPG